MGILRKDVDENGIGWLFVMTVASGAVFLPIFIHLYQWGKGLGALPSVPLGAIFMLSAVALWQALFSKTQERIVDAEIMSIPHDDLHLREYGIPYFANIPTKEIMTANDFMIHSCIGQVHAARKNLEVIADIRSYRKLDSHEERQETRAHRYLKKYPEYLDPELERQWLAGELPRTFRFEYR